MFDQTFVDGAGKTNKSWTVTLSFAAEFAVVGVMILVPLVWTEVLPKAQAVNSIMAPAQPPPPPAPPPEIPATTVATHRTARAFTIPTREIRPEAIRQVPMFIGDVQQPAAVDGIGAPDQFAVGAFGNTPGAIGTLPPPPPATPKPEPKPQSTEPLLVGGRVQNAKLIKHPSPIYPTIAKSARIQGTVVLQAVIGKDGTVQNLRTVSATSPLLIQAATDAVKQWVYQPTLLNAQPVEVITEITVTFSLQ